MSVNQSAATFGSNQNFVKAGFVAGTTTTMTTTVASMYSVQGKMYTKAVITNGATPTTDAVTGVAFNTLPTPTATALAKACIFVYVLNAAGTVGFIQGPLSDAAAVANGEEMLHFPAIPDTWCPIGYVSIKGSATQAADWTFGSSNLSSVTGITYGFADLASIPGQPVSA